MTELALSQQHQLFLTKTCFIYLFASSTTNFYSLIQNPMLWI